MDATELCRRYLQAWNRHNAEEILACFALDGRYADPMTSGPIAGAALRAYAAGLWSAFPDLRFEADEPIVASSDRVILAWTMTGTNTGSLNGLPPTGRSMSLRGVDIIRVVSQGISKVDGYFDTAAVSRQLGMQVVVQPVEVGPVKFGTSRVVRTGKQLDEGAVGITELIARSDAEIAEVQELSRQIVGDLVGKPGFIGLTTSSAGRRMTTVSTWDSVHSLRQSMMGNAHAQAMRRFLGSDLAEGGTTSVWLPVRSSSFRRCPDCRRMRRLEGRAGQCQCGAMLQSVV